MAGNKYLSNSSGELLEVAATQTSAGAGDAGKIPALDAAGKLAIAMMPTGVAPEVVSVVTSESLASGAFVNLYNNAGVLTARNADCSGGNAKRAHGFVLAAVTSPATAIVYLAGLNTAASAPSGLAVTGQAYLSTVGATTGTPPSTAAYIIQTVGVYMPGNGIQFTYDRTITLA
jgi:hypothetical protein